MANPYIQMQKIVASDSIASDFFGQTVAMSIHGNTLLIGAPSAASNEGKAYFYAYNNSSWTLEQIIA